MSVADKDIIIVRSLTESDLGIFAAHRASVSSKQRAININASVARQLLDSHLYKRGQADLKCICTFDGATVREVRRFGKSHKNWRLGGRQIKGDSFSKLDSKDFVLIRSVAGNDGSHPVTITFISRTTDRVVHAGIVAIVERHLGGSMALFESGADGFAALADHCPPLRWKVGPHFAKERPTAPDPIPLMPKDAATQKVRGPRSIKEKIKSPHILKQMLRVAGDLSAPAQLRFLETIEQLASQLRAVLIETGRIVRIDRDHAALWKSLAGQPIGFVDGGLANLAMLGSAPIAARVGGYTVVPGKRGPNREHFVVLKYLIDELYGREGEGVYDESFPDIGALRDAARIAIEAAGAVRLVSEQPDLSWVFVHGALVNPVSRYTDVMRDGRVRHRFPDFSQTAIVDLLPAGALHEGDRELNFVSVYLRQLQALSSASATVCGVVERESSTSSVCRAVLASLDDELIRSLLPEPPSEWKRWFLHAIGPSDDDEFEGQRITDPLLFRCVLEPGEALLPVPVDRNELRRAPEAWREVIRRYPKPYVSYLQVTEWSGPVRVELLEKDLVHFERTASVVLHCSLLLPRYSFPVGLDIVDKFARIPDWMSRPVNTRTAVQAMKQALDRGDISLFDSLRRMLCGSGREFLLRPGIYR